MEQKQDIEHVFNKFIQKGRAEGKSKVTLKNYRDVYKLLTDFKPDISWEDLTLSTMLDFMEHLDTRERKVGRKMVRRELKNSSKATFQGKLNPFFKFAVKNFNHLLEINPLEEIEYPDVQYTDKPAFSKIDFEKIFIAITKDIQWESRLLAKRNIAMIMLLAFTGIRKGEFLNIQSSDLVMSKKTLFIRAETSKSRRARQLALNDELIPFLNEYISERVDYKTPYLWVSNNGDHKFSEHGLKHLVKRLTDHTGINCRLHRFRHTFAVNLYKQTRDIWLVHKALGHQTLKMTMKYMRSENDDETIKNISNMTSKDFM